MTTPSRSFARQRTLVALAVLGLGTGAAHAASLSAFAGAVGGAGNGSIPQMCTTAGPPSDLAFFAGFGAGLQVLGGNAACGYSGGWSTNTGSTGTVTNSRSLPPTVLGNPGYAESFDGTAQSRASYGSLGASAHGHLDATPPSATAGTSIDVATGAAMFSDTLTASVPKSYTDLSHSGFVRYSFLIDGAMSTPGVSKAFVNGEAVTAFELQQDTGPTYAIMSAESYTGSTGTLYGAPSSGAGWTVGTGLISGGSVITSSLLAVDLTKSWDFTAGLIVNAYGNADDLFYNSAKLVGIDLYDANGNAISDFSLAAASGTHYLSAVPEPSALLLMGAGLLAGLSRVRRGSARTSRRRTAR